MPLIFGLSPARRDFAVVRTQVLTQISLSVDIVDDLSQTHRVWPRGLPVFQRADAQAVAQQKLFVEGR